MQNIPFYRNRQSTGSSSNSSGMIPMLPLSSSRGYTSIRTDDTDDDTSTRGASSGSGSNQARGEATINPIAPQPYVTPSQPGGTGGAPFPDPDEPGGDNEFTLGDAEQARRQQLIRMIFIFCLMFLLLGDGSDSTSSSSASSSTSTTPINKIIQLQANDTTYLKGYFTDLHSSKGLSPPLRQNMKGRYRGYWRNKIPTTEEIKHPETLYQLQKKNSSLNGGSVAMDMTTIPVSNLPELSFLFGIYHAYDSKGYSLDGSSTPVQGVLLNREKKAYLFPSLYDSQYLYIDILPSYKAILAKDEDEIIEDNEVKDIDNKKLKLFSAKNNKNKNKKDDEENGKEIEKEINDDEVSIINWLPENNSTSIILKPNDKHNNLIRISIKDTYQINSTLNSSSSPFNYIKPIHSIILGENALDSRFRITQIHRSSDNKLNNNRILLENNDDDNNENKNIVNVTYDKIKSFYYSYKKVFSIYFYYNMITTYFDIDTNETMHSILESILFPDKIPNSLEENIDDNNRKLGEIISHNNVDNNYGRKLTYNYDMANGSVDIIPGISTKVQPSVLFFDFSGEDYYTKPDELKAKHEKRILQYVTSISSSISSAISSTFSPSSPTSYTSRLLTSFNIFNTEDYHISTGTLSTKTPIETFSSHRTVNDITGIMTYNDEDQYVYSTTFEFHESKMRSQVEFYTLIYSLICISQVILVIQQLKHSLNPASSSKISILSICSLSLLDSVICVSHLLLGASLPRVFFASFIWISLIKLILFAVFQMRIIINILRARYNQEIANSGFIEFRNRLIQLHLRFYGVVLLSFILLFTFRTQPILLVLIFYSFYWPQIIHSVIYGTRHSFSMVFLIFNALSRIFLPLYLLACPDNFLVHLWQYISPTVEVHQNNVILYNAPNSHNILACYFLIFWLSLQIIILMLQFNYGPRFFVPKRFLPQKYDYKRMIPPHLRPEPCTTGGDPTCENHIECVICYNPIEFEENSGNNSYMITPCDHIFHDACLTQWANVKLECPVCRQTLPSLDDEEDI